MTPASRPDPSPAVRWTHAISGSLYLLVAGLLVYFLWGPYSRVTTRLREQGTPLPGWVTLAFTVGTALVTVLFVLKAVRLLRRAFRP